MTRSEPFKDPAVVTEVEQVIQRLSPREERFEWWRRSVGLFGGPIVLVIVLMLPLPGLSVAAHRLAAIASLVVTWWITEPIPIPAAAMIGAGLMVVFGVATAQEAFAPFANPIIFLFIGSFMIGRAVMDHGLDRRLVASLLSVKAVQGSVARMSMAIIALTLTTSGWMSNTATTAMMLPVALGVLSATGSMRGAQARTAGTPFLLAIAYAASIGGIMTPVGTPPNLITIGLLQQTVGVQITFFTWMVIATPIAIVIGGILVLLTTRRLASMPVPHLALALSERQPDGSSPWTSGQRNCAIAFATAVTLWVTPGALALFGSTENAAYRTLSVRMEESVAAILAAGLLFVLPTNWAERKFTLGWESAARIDWGTILLFGGGLSLGQMMFTTGLAAHIGDGLVSASGAKSLWTITAASIGIGMLMTELASNTAATNMLVPVVIAISEASGVSPVPPALGACLAASMAFMLPISTPPNAIVYGSGLVPITAMVRHGAVLDIVAAIVIFAGLRVLCPLMGFA
jgi:sodium-dependent dicarboxylate transporter 2/3/5